MKSYNIILIQIIFLFSSFIFSQLSHEELMIKREVEKGRENRALSENSIETDFVDTLITSKYSKYQSKL